MFGRGPPGKRKLQSRTKLFLFSDSHILEQRLQTCFFFSKDGFDAAATIGIIGSNFSGYEKKQILINSKS